MAVDTQQMAQSLGLLDPGSIQMARRGDNPDNPTTTEVQNDLNARAKDPLAFLKTETKDETKGPDDRASGAGTQSGTNWDSPDNPYRAKYLDSMGDDAYLSPEAKAARDDYSAGLTHIQNERAQIEQTLASQVSAKQITQEHATALVELAVQAAQSNLALKTLQRALLPAALRETADRVAKQYSVGSFSLKPEDLTGETTVQGMVARAKTLQEFHRDGHTQQRQTQGADKLESGSGSSVAPPALDDLSPFATIKEGLRRMAGRS